MGRGCLALNPATKTIAITNLTGGVDLFSLMNFAHLGTIKQKLQPNLNVTLGIAFLGGYILSGGHGQVWMNEAETLCLVSGLHNKEPFSESCSSGHSTEPSLTSFKGVYRSVSVRNLV